MKNMHRQEDRAKAREEKAIAKASEGEDNAEEAEDKSEDRLNSMLPRRYLAFYKHASLWAVIYILLWIYLPLVYIVLLTPIASSTYGFHYA